MTARSRTLVLFLSGVLWACAEEPATPTDAPILADAATSADAPRSDAGGTDAPGDAPLVPPDGPLAARCPSGAYVCEDFEDDSFAPDWSLDASDGEATIELVAAHGARGLHIHVAPSGGARALLRTSVPFPVPGNSFFGRAWVLVASPAPTVHAGLFAASGGSTEVRLGLGPTLLPNYSTPGSEFGSWAENPPRMPVDRWTCIEWAHEDVVGSDHDRLLYWIDGVEQVRHEIDGTGSDAWRFPTFERFELGMIMYHSEGSTGFDVRYDDVVLAPERVGCD